MNASAPSTVSPLPEDRQSGTHPGDTDLVAQCRAGDLAAFDVLVERHQNRIFNLCYWMLGNRDEAADAAQDAFIRAYRSLANFRGDSAFGTWLHRIAVNTALDAASRRKRAPLPYSDVNSVASDDEDSPDIDSAPAQTDLAESEPVLAALRRERHVAVREALARLPENFRQVLVLFEIEGYPYEEIAVILELPLGTVKSRINRARLRLKDELQGARELFED